MSGLGAWAGKILGQESSAKRASAGQERGCHLKEGLRDPCVAQRFSTTFSPGRDPGDLGWSPMSGSLHGACFSPTLIFRCQRISSIGIWVLILDAVLTMRNKTEGQLEGEHIPPRWVLLVWILQDHNAIIFLVLKWPTITLANTYETFIICYVMQIAYLAALCSYSNFEQKTFQFQEDKNQGLENLRALAKGHTTSKKWLWG